MCFTSNQCNGNHLPHVAASVLFADLETLAHGYDHLPEEAYSRFSSFPTANRGQNLEITLALDTTIKVAGNSRTRKMQMLSIFPCACYFTRKVLLLRVRRKGGIKKRVMETRIDEKGQILKPNLFMHLKKNTSLFKWSMLHFKFSAKAMFFFSSFCCKSSSVPRVWHPFVTLSARASYKIIMQINC